MAPRSRTLAILLAKALGAVASCNALVGAPDPIAASGDADASDSSLYESGARPGDATAGASDAGREGTEADTTISDGGGEACCTGGCTGLTSDWRNCGACGHSCQFANCSNSVCEPVTIAGSVTDNRDLFALYGLTLLNGQLYGTNWYRSYAAVYTVSPNVSVSDPTPLVTYEAGVSASPIVNDGTRLFYVMFRDEMIPIPGAAAGIYALDTSGKQSLVVRAAGVGTIAADDNYLYWTLGHTVSVAQKDGAGAVAFSTGTTYLSRIAAGSGWNWVYFIQDGALVRATPPHLDTVTSVSGSDHNVAAFALDATNIYSVDGPGDAQPSRLFSVPVSAPSEPAMDITPEAGLPAAPYAFNLLADPTSANLFYLANDAFLAKIYRLKNDGSQH